MSDILLSAFNTLFRLEGDLDNHCQAIANNRDSIQDLSKANKTYLRNQIKSFLTHENNLKQQLPLPLKCFLKKDYILSVLMKMEIYF